MVESKAQRILGKDLRVGDVWVQWQIGRSRGVREIVAIDPPRQVSACVLHASLEERHPDGMPARDVYWIGMSTGKRMGCTVFDEQVLNVERRGT